MSKPKEKGLASFEGLARRLGAMAIDSFLIGLFWFIFALVFRDLAFQLGPYGRALGLASGLAYFGILNSRIGNGQTIGKRLVGLVVSDADGNPIPLGRSLLRTAIWVLPALILDWGIPVLTVNPLLVMVCNGIGYGMYLAVGYTLLFNRAAGQTFYDMLSKTYVLSNRRHAKNYAERELPVTPQLHWRVAGILLIVGTLALPVIYLVSTPKSAGADDISQLNASLSADPRLFSAFISVSTVTESSLLGGNGSTTTHYLNVDAWYKGSFSEEQGTTAAQDFAGNLLTRGVDIADGYVLRIRIKQAYDFYFGSGNLTFTSSHYVGEWRTTLGLQP